MFGRRRKHVLMQATYRQRWQAPDVPAELAKRVICACIREMCFMGLKRQKFSWPLLTRNLYTRQLACEPQTGSLAYFSVAVRNGKKKTISSLDRSFTSSSTQAAMQGQTVLNVKRVISDYCLHDTYSFLEGIELGSSQTKRFLSRSFDEPNAQELQQIEAKSDIKT